MNRLPSNISNFVDIIRYRSSQQPRKRAFRFLENGKVETDSLTYCKLDKQSRAIAAKLQTIASTGDRALLIYPPGLDFITAFFGCLYAGVIAIPTYPPKPNRSMERQDAIVGDCQPTLVLTTTSLLTSLGRNIERHPQLKALSWLTTDNINLNWATEWKSLSINRETLAFLQYTSGSTGTPKGVMVTHNNLMCNSALINRYFQDTLDSIGVSWLPPYHDMGLIGGILQPIYVGGTMFLMPPLAFLYQPSRWLDAISRYKATTSGGPNFAYDLCIKKIKPEQRQNLDLSSWEIAFTGAEPIRSQSLELFYEAFQSYGFRKKSFHPCYGMAETTLMVSGGRKDNVPVLYTVSAQAIEQNKVVPGNPLQERVRTFVGCGEIRKEGEILIVSPHNLKLCQPEEIGEIWVKNSSVAQGYWNNKVETNLTFEAYTTDNQRGPFLRTGDLGFLRCNELFVTGRLKDLIIIRGCNYYPQDLELTVETSSPAFRPGCGVAFSIEFMGEEKLVIVQEVERIFLHKLDSQNLFSKIRQCLSEEYSLDVYVIVLTKPGGIPKTSSGKVRRRACKMMLLESKIDVIAEWRIHNIQQSLDKLKAGINYTSMQLQASRS
ncbi:MAG: fatty acyl-AMP ligase [Symploca sp. SIO1B1]|nr:fatty acyl-AMP ligase [Symploca sp. SIO1B1]